MKYLPSEIEINGVTYYSGLELASKQLDWYNLGKAVGVEEGKKEATLEKVDQFNKGYEIGKYDGYEQCKHDGISKINLNTEPVEQTELSKEYDKGFTKGYEEGFEEGLNEGYEIGKKANGISKKEIPGEYIAHIEVARLEGYKEGYTTGFDNGLDAATIANTTAVKPSPCNHGECIAGKEEEYDKGYYAGWEDGKNHIMQFI